MSFARKNPHKVSDSSDLGARLVSDETEAPVLPDTSATAAANAAGSSPTILIHTEESPPGRLPSIVTSHSLNKALHSHSHATSSASSSTASHNNPQHSALASGQRDMELVDLGIYDGATRDSHLLVPNDDRERDITPSSATSMSPSEEGLNISTESKNGMGDEPRSARVWPSVLRDGWKAYILRSLQGIFLSTKTNILLLAVPIAIICKLANWGDGPLFVFSLIALCPLAERISYVTDEMAMYTNDTVGGLLSATMGNATELIVSIFALRDGLLRVVQLSLLGSVFSNLLLVQGTAFLVGGLKFTQQKYSQAAAKTNMSLLLLALMGLMFPMVLLTSNSLTSVVNSDSGATITVGGITIPTTINSTSTLVDTEGISTSNELALSRLASVLMLIVYGLLIFYQLKTHSHLFESREEEEDEEPEPPILGPWGSIFWAIVVTVFISILSEFIVSAIDGAATEIGIPVLFSATILLPIVGNAAEHASAIIFARRDQMDIALGIAVGSATQISMFVIPLMVILGWMSGHPLSLDFQVFETISLFLTVTMTSLILSTGKSDWLYGVMMMVAYAIISGAFWLQNQPADLK